MLRAFDNKYLYMLPQGYMGSRITPKERALNDATLKYLYEKNLGEPLGSNYAFQLTNDGAEYLGELKLVDDDELTHAGATLLYLASAPDFKPPMDRTAPVLLQAIKEELLAKEDVAPLFKSVEWNLSLEPHDYAKLNDYLQKQLRRLFDAYLENLEIPATESRSAYTYNAQPVLNIGHINNYGVVNSGTMSDIEQINIKTDAMSAQYKDISLKLKHLTEAVQDAELSDEIKERAIDGISTLSTEIAKDLEQQKKWKINETLDNLGKLLTGGAAAYEGYEKVEPYFNALVMSVKAALSL